MRNLTSEYISNMIIVPAVDREDLDAMKTIPIFTLLVRCSEKKAYEIVNYATPKIVRFNSIGILSQKACL